MKDNTLHYIECYFIMGLVFGLFTMLLALCDSQTRKAFFHTGKPIIYGVISSLSYLVQSVFVWPMFLYLFLEGIFEE